MLGKRYYIQKEEYDVSKIVMIYLRKEGKVEDMCNFSLGVYEDGRIDAKVESVKNLMETLKFTMEEAMISLCLSEEEKDTCRNKLKGNLN